MTKEKLAEKLNGRQYTKEISKEEESLAKENGLVVVFGASDDLMEFAGAIDDELGAYDGTTAYLDGLGLLENKCEESECPYFQAACEIASKIEAMWDEEGYDWIYKTDIPHATFEIFDGTEKYCRGIVFKLSELGASEVIE
jgi:hypothetical protein